MDENRLNALDQEEDSVEEIALIVENIIDILPAQTALAICRCIVLHWFDLSIVEALLEDQELTIDEMSDIYQQISTLPFIDTLHLGLTFHYTIRQKLLHDYSRKQPELLQIASHMAAPVYGSHEDDDRNMIEAFFCSIVAGDQEYGMNLQNILLEQGKFHDWYYFEKIFHAQDEAEALSFVDPLPRTEQQLLLRGFIHRMNKEMDAALQTYNQLLDLHPNSAIGYINRGITYAEQEHFEEALNNYNTALQIDPNATQAYANRAVIYAKLAHYEEAIRDFKKANETGLPDSRLVFRYQGESFYQLGRYEEALASYNQMLLLDSEDVAAYLGQGQSYNQLKDYESALDSFERTLVLNPDSAEAYRGKGYALNELKRHAEALTMYNKVLDIDPDSIEAYKGKGYALNELKRYEEALTLYNKALDIDPDSTEVFRGREEALSGLNVRQKTPQPKQRPIYARFFQERYPRAHSGNTKISTFIQVALLVVILVVILVSVVFLPNLSTLELSMPTNTAVVTAIQHTGKLETTTDTLQQIIVYDPNPNSWWNFLGDNKKLFIVQGTVTAGIDLSTLNANDVQIQGKSITLDVPATQILSTTVDPSKSQIYDTNTGIFSIWNQNLDGNTTNQILTAAQSTLRSDACNNGILLEASKSAKSQLTTLLTTLGFSTVTVNVTIGTCH